MTDNHGDVLSPLPVAPVNETDMILLPEGLKALARLCTFLHTRQTACSKRFKSHGGVFTRFGVTSRCIKTMISPEMAPHGSQDSRTNLYKVELSTTVVHARILLKLQ
jgi:hypothetical protein